jgi:predicted metal-dependent hydrolase
MSEKMARDARYVAFFECFNRQKYYEAHDVLEEFWMETKENRDFYKGLIQLAAGFLKLKQGKGDGARRLLLRSMHYLEPFAPKFEGLDVAAVLKLQRKIVDALEQQPNVNPFDARRAPQLFLEAA